MLHVLQKSGGNGCILKRAIMGSYMSFHTNRDSPCSLDRPVLMPTVGIRKPKTLIIYHDKDLDFIRKQLMPTLTEDGIDCYTLEDNIEEQNIFRKFGYLSDSTDKTLFVLSLQLKKDPILSYLPSISIARKRNVICLRLDRTVFLEDDLACLIGTKIVESESTGWRAQLIRHIRYQRPHFSHFIGAREVTQSLHQHGLDLPLMLFSVYGVTVEISNEILRIDMDEFLEHSQKHSELGITEVCGECSMLCTPDTKVSLVYDKDTIKTNKDFSKFDSAFASLCGNIMDVSTLRKAGVVFILGCTLNGRLVGEDYIRQLWVKTRYQITTEKSPSHEIKFPKYADEKARFDSFPVFSPNDRVPKTELLAKAGYFFSGPPLFTTCFACGRFVISWREDDNPWVTHSALNQACPFVRQNQTYDFIKNAKESFRANNNRVNETYRSLEARVKSFESFSLDKMPQDNANLFSREKLIVDIAGAGFNYTGCGDAFTCYSCGLVLTSIRRGENVMATHARLSSSCAYVISAKGTDYVDGILQTAAHASPRTVVSFMIKKLDNRSISHQDIFLFPPSQSKP
ncbi:uncharacterized protein LOC132557544 [Ylistrum balloti]|uniref:uncharacterized protein LOC132557544 n=1 Tax=Ylistrum balloti TaxID=509963 RepID=UPI0029059C52|nr:uncharacterized protein LOC132557544 [Ylistrum balloti]